MFINMINVKWLLLHTNFLHFCYILVHNFMDYILNLWRKKPGNRNYVCMVPCCQWSQLSSLLQDNITKDNKQAAPCSWRWWWFVIYSLIPFFPSFLCYPCCTERVAVMTKFLCAIILDLWSQFLLRVPTSSRHIQCNFAFTHFLWVAVGCSVILGRSARPYYWPPLRGA